VQVLPVSALSECCQAPPVAVQPLGVDDVSGEPLAVYASETSTGVVTSCALTDVGVTVVAVHTTCSVNPLVAVPETTLTTFRVGAHPSPTGPGVITTEPSVSAAG
jgi:hypothetical protein